MLATTRTSESSPTSVLVYDGVVVTGIVTQPSCWRITVLQLHVRHQLIVYQFMPSPPLHLQHSNQEFHTSQVEVRKVRTLYTGLQIRLSKLESGGGGNTFHGLIVTGYAENTMCNSYLN